MPALDFWKSTTRFAWPLDPAWSGWLMTALCQSERRARMAQLASNVKGPLGGDHTFERVEMVLGYDFVDLILRYTKLLCKCFFGKPFHDVRLAPSQLKVSAQIIAGPVAAKASKCATC